VNVRLVAALLAGAQILNAGTALADVIGPKWAGFIGLVVGAAQAALAAYRSGEPRPVEPAQR
jgi:hypothetical protein